MEKLNFFDDLLHYCLDNKDTLGKRDVIASLSYMRTLRNFNLSNPMFKEYSDFICSNLDMFTTSLHLVIHRFGVLGYNPALLKIYECHLKNKIESFDPKQLCLIGWSYAKSNVYIQDLFERIAAAYFYRKDLWNLTDDSLMLWSFSKIERRVPQEIADLRNDILETLQSIVSALRNPEEPIDKRVTRYLDNDRLFIANVPHDVCMASKALATLVPRDKQSVKRMVELLLEVVKIANLSLTAQGITSLWESLSLAAISDPDIVNNLCEVSRYLRLDHSFNSNMLNAILTAIHALKIHDPRVVYQIVHWLEKRAVQMHPPQIYNAICILDDMGIYHDKAWKQLGVIIQKKGIDLELSDLRRVYNIFKRNGKGNDRIFGILEHFLSCKEDTELYGPQ
ncbi:hypothetical protein BgAZ_201600 [Babesia gibsoni]|uniref:Uncharacterized protein n=1 Tax=Babesia gibsoni TaxID=33632 RepID=A0AAD8PDT9_BABGI|nr:hypothetical protein BgAZ_201600 [Babesia gibsoni]